MFSNVVSQRYSTESERINKVMRHRRRPTRRRLPLVQWVAIIGGVKVIIDWPSIERVASKCSSGAGISANPSVMEEQAKIEPIRPAALHASLWRKPLDNGFNCVRTADLIRGILSNNQHCKNNSVLSFSQDPGPGAYEIPTSHDMIHSTSDLISLNP